MFYYCMNPPRRLLKKVRTLNSVSRSERRISNDARQIFHGGEGERIGLDQWEVSEKLQNHSKYLENEPHDSPFVLCLRRPRRQY